MRVSQVLLATHLAVAILAWSVVVHAGDAEPGSADESRRALALLLFREGRRLVELERYAEAIRSFEQSNRLESRPATMLNLGYCYERLGQTTRAWAAYHWAASEAQVAHRPDREEEALAQATRLEGGSARVVIGIADDQMALDGFEVDLDGATLPREGVGQPIPVGAGRHEVRAKAVGKKEWSRTFEVNPGAAVPDIPVPALEEEPTKTAPARVPEPEPRATPGPSGRPSAMQRHAALVMGGVGVAALATSAGLLVWTKSTADAAQASSPKATPRASAREAPASRRWPGEPTTSAQMPARPFTWGS